MKLMLVCTSGGHFTTMKDIEPFWSQHERVWVTDLKKDTSLLNELKERVYWLPYQGPRDWKRFLINLPKSLEILLLERPDMVISTGANIAVNFAILAKLLGIRFLYIESISRSDELSLSGKFIYPIADEFYVQWQELTEKYPRAIFKGTVT
ncbi:MAG: PssD/Cps14F family polysaccharide biosynthesis glycosyltransferase [Cyanobacteriota bacterium]